MLFILVKLAVAVIFHQGKNFVGWVRGFSHDLSAWFTQACTSISSLTWLLCIGMPTICRRKYMPQTPLSNCWRCSLVCFCSCWICPWHASVVRTWDECRLRCSSGVLALLRPLSDDTFSQRYYFLGIQVCKIRIICPTSSTVNILGKEKEKKCDPSTVTSGDLLLSCRPDIGLMSSKIISLSISHIAFTYINTWMKNRNRRPRCLCPCVGHKRRWAFWVI